MFYVLLFPFRLFSLSVFVVFDHVCLAHERASILDCTQEIFVSHPEKWVLVWLGSSIVSSIFVISLIRLNRKQLNCDLVFKAMWELAPLWKKGSFWSLNFLCLITCLHYFIQIAINRFTCLSLFLIFWLIATLSFVYCLNYLPLVWKLPPGDTRNSKDVKKHRITFICLIITLIIYLIENAFMTLAMMLDAALEVVPKIQKKYKGQFSDGVILLLLAFRVLFITRLLSFFWSKVFHRNKDFFSDQNPRLVDDEMQPILKSGNNNEMPAQPKAGSAAANCTQSTWKKPTCTGRNFDVMPWSHFVQFCL